MLENMLKITFVIFIMISVNALGIVALLISYRNIFVEKECYWYDKILWFILLFGIISFNVAVLVVR